MNKRKFHNDPKKKPKQNVIDNKQFLSNSLLLVLMCTQRVQIVFVFVVDSIPVIACRRGRSYGLGIQQEPPTRFDSGVGASANEPGNHHPTADPCIQNNMRAHIFR